MYIPMTQQWTKMKIEMKIFLTYSMREIFVVERARLEPRTSLIGTSDPTN